MSTPRLIDIAKLKRFQPGARWILYEGRCDVCKRPGLYSYVLSEHRQIRIFNGEQREDCGYYCASCGWGNAGSRGLEEEDEEHCQP